MSIEGTSINMQEQPSKARVITANKMLQAKVGRGKLKEEQERACEVALAEETENFEPVAMDFLRKLEIALEDAAQSKDDDLDAHKERLFKPVFDLKASAKMYNYDLISIMTNIMVGFLEKINRLDKDAVEIVKAHHNTLTLIVMKKMVGTGGEAGKALAKELQGACARYFEKRKS